MKRKIAAIFAADIAGYSRLVAEDEEETLRRLAAYRAVTDDFIAKAGGRIFNTAGDAVLAEFPSAVEAVRCAIDIQESLRTRNMAYPPSRQMNFRIGITIGDVVERDGDLLGDGVNIAARLEGLAEVGGICISRAVHEQVANKLSVQFADIGEQEVKNIPTPVHAYMVAMRREDGTYATPQVKKPPPKPAAAGAPSWMWPAVVLVVALFAIGVAGFLYFTKLELPAGRDTAPPEKMAAASPVAPSPSQIPVATSAPRLTASPSPAPTSANAVSPSPLSPSPSSAPGEKIVAQDVPFIGERTRANLASEYVGGADHKAFALTTLGVPGFVVGQPSEEAARNGALELCQKRADSNPAGGGRHCEIYAIGNTVVYQHGKPPMPPQPWIRNDPPTERPFASKDMPLVRDQGKARLDAMYVPARKSRSIALGPGGQFIFNSNGESIDESARRALESCGVLAGVPCMIVAADDNFVVPVPTIMKATGFFHAAGNASIIADARDDVTRRLNDAASGWNAVAVGTQGRPGLGLKAANEQNAVNEALANCAKRDTDCHVIAVGPFTVGPN
ncbi:adenylate/guanylate cyclase domain-containing protein [Bradyrhizobium sp. Tv2a-2]|uniref:adenylate/guanylate cyclase domain-containing protein n=1 Tax=Bradyrhizobium sp. Tv2a-2 TaxID=113395 RepID=UPI0004138C9B|nr:adenylate/guanylate cyclase domain-containing protein [Bradyrhizobium sp. Tv2a-2]